MGALNLYDSIHDRMTALFLAMFTKRTIPGERHDSRMVHFRSPRGDRQGKVGEIQYRIPMLLYWLPPPEII